MQIEAKLQALGLVLPEPMKMPTMRLPFAPVRVRGNRAYISGAGPLNPDGSLAEPLGKVGVEVSQEQAYQAARLVALCDVYAALREERTYKAPLSHEATCHSLLNGIPAGEGLHSGQFDPALLAVLAAAPGLFQAAFAS